MTGWGRSQTRAQKDAPLGWKWCSRCGETKRLSEFSTTGGEGRARPARLGSWDDPKRRKRPMTVCKACCATHQRKKKAERKQAES